MFEDFLGNRQFGEIGAHLSSMANLSIVSLNNRKEIRESKPVPSTLNFTFSKGSLMPKDHI